MNPTTTGSGSREYSSLLGPVENADLVISAVNFLMRSISSARPRVSKRNKEGIMEPVADHPLVTLLLNPNPDHTGVQLMQATISSKSIYGEAYWRKGRGRGRNRQVTELWYTAPDRMEPVVSETTGLIGILQVPDGLAFGALDTG